MKPPALSRATLDRAAERRTDAGWLAEAWADPASQVLVLDDKRRTLVDGDSLVLVPPAEAPQDGERYLLGIDAAGVVYWAASGELPRRLGVRPGGLRDVGALLADRDAGMFVQAVALANWHATHTHCPRCGAATEIEQAGYTRRCPADGSDHFPRTDPAVIMLVHDGGDRALLGHQPSWPPGFYSTLAGFVEPGESLEQAVAREVLEEVGVTVRDVRYEGSQPWPFPSSLMLGFTAVADVGELHLQDGEIEDARWVSRDEVRDGTLRLPTEVSIARRLVDSWLLGE